VSEIFFMQQPCVMLYARNVGREQDTYRAVYMHPKYPEAANCMTIPTNATTPQPIREARGPYRSAKGYASRAPKTQPSWRKETMLADSVAASFLLKPSKWYFLRSLRVSQQPCLCLGHCMGRPIVHTL
jgi:hypothetical protein